MIAARTISELFNPEKVYEENVGSIRFILCKIEKHE